MSSHAEHVSLPSINELLPGTSPRPPSPATSCACSPDLPSIHRCCTHPKFSRAPPASPATHCMPSLESTTLCDSIAHRPAPRRFTAHHSARIYPRVHDAELVRRVPRALDRRRAAFHRACIRTAAAARGTSVVIAPSFLCPFLPVFVPPSLPPPFPRFASLLCTPSDLAMRFGC